MATMDAYRIFKHPEYMPELAKENLGMQIPTLFNFKEYLKDYKEANKCKHVCLNPVKADYEVYQE